MGLGRDANTDLHMSIFPKDAVALQRVKLLMSDLQSALQLVLAECWLTERAASRAARRQRCCLRAW